MTAIAPVGTDALLPVYRRLPLEIVSGAGVHLTDADGRSYLDFTSGIAVNALGYGDPGLVEAMRSAAEGLVHVSNLYGTAPGRMLAEALVSRSFASSVFFCNSGAEANEGAFKFARRWARTTRDAGATEIVALRGSFHGRLFGSLAATDRPAYRAPFRPLAPGISIVERDIDAIEGALLNGTVAAVIAEPVQGEGGVRVLAPEFLRALRQLTRAHGVALILDEVQCGLGRTGSFFAYEQAGIEPDLLTLAKPLAGGLPMGAVLLSSEIAATIKPGDHATTFGGGPFVASVANYVVERLSDPDLLDSVSENGAWLGNQLASLAQRLPTVRAARGIGYMWGIDVTMPAGQIVTAAMEAGLLVCSAGEHTVRLLPPLVATREELAEGLGILEDVLRQ
ncbi:MAG: acetylornithine transaminase [Gemmatimonadaceae bacterium]|nr:acetylornithine transaminase [Gemmatimonadaceae bacterium]NUQ93240.1 acetylornithine transaminase [Gemmatimonadaceae bacterium]NUR21235.1 acetylornithine transaminase [Gemmatimonadaceae bacterium]NUS98167.1 acetylornithine transaminase [Gemmatimonadaceae bacterium]